jgi:[ribosomal protein S18]-alanine N-acetyltransferase
VSSDFVTVASMTPDDLDDIMPLERRCFADPWTRRMYLSDLTTNEAATYLTLRIADSRWPLRVANGKWPRDVEDGGGQTADRTSELSATLAPALRSGASAGVGYQPPAILAYGGFWLLLDEAHIATVASHPDWRGCGLGEWLMLALLNTAVLRGAVTSTLEVRVGNLPAKRLYEKLGYEVAGVRKRYYRDGEDGLIMTTPPLAGPVMQTRLAAARQDALHRLERCFDEGRMTKDER